MTGTIACALAWIAALVLLPLIAIWHFTKPRHQRISEMRSRGWTWKQVASYYGCSPTTARRWAAA